MDSFQTLFLRHVTQTALGYWLYQHLTVTISYMHGLFRFVASGWAMKVFVQLLVFV